MELSVASLKVEINVMAMGNGKGVCGKEFRHQGRALAYNTGERICLVVLYYLEVNSIVPITAYNSLELPTTFLLFYSTCVNYRNTRQ